MLQKNRPFDFYVRDKFGKDNTQPKKLIMKLWRKLSEDEKMPYERAHLEYISKMNTELTEESVDGNKLIDTENGNISAKVGKIIELHEEGIIDQEVNNIIGEENDEVLVNSMIEKVKPKSEKKRKDLDKKFLKLVSVVNDIYKEVQDLNNIIKSYS